MTDEKLKFLHFYIHDFCSLLPDRKNLTKNNFYDHNFSHEHVWTLFLVIIDLAINPKQKLVHYRLEKTSHVLMEQLLDPWRYAKMMTKPASIQILLGTIGSVAPLQ